MAPVSTDCSSDSPGASVSQKEAPNGLCRSVSFSHQGEFFSIPNIDEYTETERRMMWFENYEYTQIKVNNKILVKMMKSGHYPEDQQYCYRGLEFKTIAGHRQRRNAKTTAAMAIFSEQRRQWDDGEQDNIEGIRMAYEEISRQCHVRAHKIALKDSAIADISSSAARPCPTYTPQDMQVEFRVSSLQEDAASILTDDTETDIWSTQSGDTKSIGSADVVGPSLCLHSSLIRTTPRPQRAAKA